MKKWIWKVGGESSEDDRTENGKKNDNAEIETSNLKQNEINWPNQEQGGENITNGRQGGKEIEEEIIEHGNETTRRAEQILNEEETNEKYTIYVKGINTDITRLNSIRIKKEICQMVERDVKIAKSGQSLRIECVNQKEYITIKSITTLTGCDVIISDPYKRKEGSYFKTSRGIIFGVDSAISEEEICEATDAKSAKRIVKYLGGRNITTAQVILTYDGDFLPPFVYLGYRRHRVETFIPEPMRCFRCQRFGHKQTDLQREQGQMCNMFRKTQFKGMPGTNKESRRKEGYMSEL